MSHKKRSRYKVTSRALCELMAVVLAASVAANLRPAGCEKIAKCPTVATAKIATPVGIVGVRLPN